MKYTNTKWRAAAQHEPDYYSGKLTGRTRALLKKERPVRPLLTILLQILQGFQASLKGNESRGPVKDLDTKRFRNERSGTGEDALYAESDRGVSNDAVRWNREDLLNEDGSFDLMRFVTESELQSLGLQDSSLVEILFQVIGKQASSKARFVTRKILFESKNRIGFLLDCPYVLEREIETAVKASRKRRTGRRRRGSRVSKKAKRMLKK